MEAVRIAYGVPRERHLRSSAASLESTSNREIGRPPSTPTTGWRSAEQLEAKLGGVRHIASALELENQLLRSEGARKSARIAQLEDAVSSLEAELLSLDQTVRASLDLLAFRPGQPLSADAAATLDAAVDEAYAEEAEADASGEEEDDDDDDDWISADWIASLGTCEMIAKALLKPIRMRDCNARLERRFVGRVGARDCRRTVYELLGNSGVLERVAGIIWEGASRLERAGGDRASTHRTPARYRSRGGAGEATRADASTRRPSFTLFCHATERKLELLPCSTLELQSVVQRGPVLQLDVCPLATSSDIDSNVFLSSSNPTVTISCRIGGTDAKEERRMGRAPSHTQLPQAPARGNTAPPPAPSRPPRQRDRDGGDWLSREREGAVARGVPWCATWAPDGGCYLWYHLPNASGLVDARYRSRGQREWVSHQPATVQVLPGSWWRTPSWPHAGDASFEQSCWVGGECVIAGIIGPTDVQPMLPDGVTPPTPAPSPHGQSTAKAHSTQKSDERRTCSTVSCATRSPAAEPPAHPPRVTATPRQVASPPLPSEDFMVWCGVRYVRIWALLRPERGRFGGGFTTSATAIRALASNSSSIHIRMANQPAQNVTLQPGVDWPLERLRRGLPFDTTLHGVDVTKAVARVTWTGTMVDSMWNRGMSKYSEGTSISDGDLYHAAGNPNGLFLCEGERCEFRAGFVAPVEVWLGAGDLDVEWASKLLGNEQSAFY